MNLTLSKDDQQYLVWGGETEDIMKLERGGEMRE